MQQSSLKGLILGFHALLITTISLKSMISEISREEKAQNEPNFTEIGKSEKYFPK